MQLNLLMTISLSFLLGLYPACPSPNRMTLEKDITGASLKVYKKIAGIPLPDGYVLLPAPAHSFAAWLQRLPLKKDHRVHLYNGELKKDQSVQFAVLDVPVGSKDLQQCADAVMRLRACWLYDEKRFAEISFSDNNGKRYSCPANINPPGFEKYLEQVFANCGTLSLAKQLHRVNDITGIEPGDVLIRGGSPGHAMMVMEVAQNAEGKRMYMLAQSYMPAQDIHIVKNFNDLSGNPWYSADKDKSLIITPEWTFFSYELRRW